MARPIDDNDRRRVRELHAQGKSRNEIARTIDRSPSTVSKIADELGLSFDRAAQVETATRIRAADLAARRVAFAERLQDIAEREADKLTAPTLYWEWGGKDHRYAEKIQPEPHAADRRAIMATIATALDRSLKLVPPRDESAEQRRSMVTDLMDGLRRYYAAHLQGAPAEGGEGGAE